MKNILICGPPGVGKTTLVKKILENINLRAGGFYTEEIKENNRRVGFKIISLDNQEGILAHISIKNSRRVGRYGVNIYDLENIGVKCLNQALKDDDLILIDEIGKMEVFSEEFKEKVLDCLNSKKIVLATISIGGDKFISNIKRRDDIILFEITKENRNKLIEIISSLIFNFRKRF
jgi:nucleoside-triphosphatase